MLIALAIVVLLIVGLLAYAATRPSAFRIERALRMDAPPEAIAPLILDFHRWQAWSPWEKLDPALAREFSGAPAGVGAVYAWRSQGKAGVGRMEITAATAQRIAIDLRFFKPFAAHNQAEFTLTPGPGSAPGRPATTVHWAMSGPSPFVSKLMGVFVDFDRMVGKDFEAGLAAMKASAESGTSGPASAST